MSLLATRYPDLAADRLCHYCGVVLLSTEEARALPDWTRERTIDHKVPVSRGGTDHRSNLVASCRQCNTRKGLRPYLEYLFTLWIEEAAA